MNRAALVLVVVATSLVLGAKSARSAEPATAELAPATNDARGAVDESSAAPAPPPLNSPFLQYGVALTAELLASAGPLCNIPTEPCILGSGGGIAVRLGKRTAGPWYFGGTYELSKQDPNKLYRLAILQQARGELRYYLSTGRDVEPYASAAAGVAGYGNEWSIDTFGPVAALSAGAEFEISRRLVAGLALSYRGIYFRGFVDSSRTQRDTGLASFVGVDLLLEARDPL